MKIQQPRITDDFSNFLGDDRKSRKQTLIDECIARGVSIYRDDASEATSGDCSMFRAVAAESELEKRMIAQMGFNQARRAFKVQVLTGVFAFLGLLVAVTTFVKPFLVP